MLRKSNTLVRILFGTKTIQATPVTAKVPVKAKEMHSKGDA
jgi:hypothetical protein